MLEQVNRHIKDQLKTIDGELRDLKTRLTEVTEQLDNIIDAIRPRL